jgi:metal-responsive CopG/Arc/MetJ family transcriptional regulator
MKSASDNSSLTLPPALLAEIEAEANEEHRDAVAVLQDAVKHYVTEKRWQRTLAENRDEILARVDAAEASLARGEGIPITQASMRQLAEDVKQRGRARLAAENRAPR